MKKNKKQNINNHSLPIVDFPVNSAARIMTKAVPVVSPQATIADIEKLLLDKPNEFESINYVYVVNSDGILKGAISVKEIFRQSKSAKVADIMVKDLIVAKQSSSQLKAAYLALQHNIKAVPVVDKGGKFVGVVMSEDIMDIIYAETNRHVFAFSGQQRPEMFIDNVFSMSIWKSLKHRLPWLLIGLLGGLLAAKIIGGFESTLGQNLILAAFIPLIVYMADAVGTQVEAFFIRDSAIHLDLNFLAYFLRQMLIVFLIAVVSGVVLMSISSVLYNDFTIGIVLAISLFCAIMSAVLSGLIVPYFLSKMRLDPANASGPIATIIQDILSVTIYFSVAAWLL